MEAKKYFHNRSKPPPDAQGQRREWHSRMIPRYQHRAEQVDEAILGVYLSGTDTRRLRRTGWLVARRSRRMPYRLPGAPEAPNSAQRGLGALKFVLFQPLLSALHVRRAVWPPVCWSPPRAPMAAPPRCESAAGPQSQAASSTRGLVTHLGFMLVMIKCYPGRCALVMQSPVPKRRILIVVLGQSAFFSQPVTRSGPPLAKAAHYRTHTSLRLWVASQLYQCKALPLLCLRHPQR